MRIRPATSADLSALVQLEEAVFGTEGYPRFVLRQAWDLWPSSLLVASTSDELVGYVLAGRGETSGWILSLGVTPHVRGTGVGRRLVTSALEILERQGCRCVRLSVAPSTAALKLYESLGFVEVGREKEYFGVGEPRLLMVRE